MDDIHNTIMGDVADETIEGFEFCKTFFKECIVILKRPDLTKRLAINEANFNRLLVRCLFN